MIPNVSHFQVTSVKDGRAWAEKFVEEFYILNDPENITRIAGWFNQVIDVIGSEVYMEGYDEGYGAGIADGDKDGEYS